MSSAQRLWFADELKRTDVERAIEAIVLTQKTAVEVIPNQAEIRCYCNITYWQSARVVNDTFQKNRYRYWLQKYRSYRYEDGKVLTSMFQISISIICNAPNVARLFIVVWLWLEVQLSLDLPLNNVFTTPAIHDWTHKNVIENPIVEMVSARYSEGPLFPKAPSDCDIRVWAIRV